MKRIYEHIMKDHLKNDRQMIFFEGPRQVGKTTTSKTAAQYTQQFIYLNWDYDEDQQLILEGPESIIKQYNLNAPQATAKAIIVFDEIHKYRHWRNYLKGFYDKQSELIKFIVTGSYKLDVYRTAGDSLMGRYFSYRIHPLSVAELISTQIEPVEIKSPKALDPDIFLSLVKFGGYPEPLIKQNNAFYRRWSKLRSQQLFNIDIKELTRIHETAQMKFLSSILKNQIGGLLNYNQFSKSLRVSNDTISKWINTLSSFYYCFTISPWTKNITRSLLKQPKLYLWDWSMIDDLGARHENLIAAHLLKAIHLWEDRGLGEYKLYFIRDKEKREIDFLVTKNDTPWFLVEVKSKSNKSINENLYHFQKQTQAKHAFQVVFDLPFQEINCFDYQQPIIVPALTFLSQLV